MTILIFSLIAQASYAEDAQPKEGTEAASTEETATGLSMETMGDIPDATPGGGLSGSIMPFLSESFQTDLATGAATLTIPITIPPGRKNMQPNLALSYSSNNSNGICGVGWAIPTNCIQRSTKKGVPKYDNNTDTFMFASSGSNAELVDIGDNQYRAKLESAFMKHVFSGNVWTVYDKSGTKYTFGSSNDSKLENGGNTFAWYLKKVEDVYGNAILFTYIKNEAQIYLSRIEYTSNDLVSPALPANKFIVFNYDNRTDKLYSYRSGWKIATTKRLSSIEVYLDGTLDENLVWRYELSYGNVSSNTGRSLLRSITVYDKTGASLPPKTFTYQTLQTLEQ